MKLRKVLLPSLLCLTIGNAFAGQAFISAEGNYGGPQTPTEELLADLDKYNITVGANGDSLVISTSDKDGNNSFGGGAEGGYLFDTAVQSLKIGAAVNFQYYGDTVYSSTHTITGTVTFNTPVISGTAIATGDLKDNVTYSDYSAGLVGVMNYSFTQAFYTQTEFGLALVHQDTSHIATIGDNFAFNGQSLTEDQRSLVNDSQTRNIVRPELGLSVGYKFTQHIAAYVGFDYIAGSGSSPNPRASNINDISFVPDMMSYKLGATYFF